MLKMEDCCIDGLLQGWLCKQASSEETLSLPHRSCHQIIFYALISTFWVSSSLMLAFQAWPSWHSGYPLWPSFLVKLLWHPLPILPFYCSIEKLSSLPVPHSGSFRTVRWIQLIHSKLHPIINNGTASSTPSRGQWKLNLWRVSGLSGGSYLMAYSRKSSRKGDEGIQELGTDSI